MRPIGYTVPLRSSRSARRTGKVRPFLAIALVFFAVLATRPAAQSPKIAIPSYVQPGSTIWNTWAAYPQAVAFMIVNLDNGDDTSYQPSVLAAVQSAQQSGIKVLGYTYTEYGERDPITVELKIAAAMTNYQLDGMFLDQAPTSCTATTPFGESTYLYYQGLANYARQFNASGTVTVVLNPGTPPATDCWMSVADILVTYENKGISNYQHSYTDMAWVHSYPASRFWNLLYAVQRQSDMETAFNLAQQRNVGLIYVTSLGGGNPWDGIPSYWAAEAVLN